jgi:hypothetical protein
MVLDVETRTVRVLERVEHRDYGDIKPSEIPMTIDAVAFGLVRARYYDWKTSTKGEHADQLLTGALALSLAWHGYEVSAAPVYVLEQAAHTGDVLEPDALDWTRTRQCCAGSFGRCRRRTRPRGPGARIVTASYARNARRIALG